MASLVGSTQRFKEEPTPILLDSSWKWKRKKHFLRSALPDNKPVTLKASTDPYPVNTDAKTLKQNASKLNSAA